MSRLLLACVVVANSMTIFPRLGSISTLNVWNRKQRRLGSQNTAFVQGIYCLLKYFFVNVKIPSPLIFEMDRPKASHSKKRVHSFIFHFFFFFL